MPIGVKFIAFAAGLSLAATTVFAADPNLLVVDSTGTVIGSLQGQNQVQRQVGSVWVQLAPGVLAQGLNTFTTATLFYTSANCSGPAYMDANNLPVTGQMVTPAGGLSAVATLYYPATPYQSLPIGSISTIGGTCSATSFNDLVGVAATANLNFLPPFSIK